MDKSGWNMYVFRDGRLSVPGYNLVSALSDALRTLAEAHDREKLLTALLAAGELECALADAGSEHVTQASVITDAVATALVKDCRVENTERFLAGLKRINPPEVVQLSVHEGFAYYALHPLKFARVVEALGWNKNVGVVGIRSIGVALSAVTAAALNACGATSSRITVRPTGHPYDRKVQLSREQQIWVRELRDAELLVVDEGPGLSGSSFLAAAEALEREGLSASSISLLGTRAPDPSGLRAPEAERRWSRFRSLSTANEPFLPEGADIPLGGGRWRDVLMMPGSARPSSWTQLEALKYVSSDQTRFFRFEGYGHYGEEAADRSHELGQARFSPLYFGNFAGFGCYEYFDGRPISPDQVTPTVLAHVARYCAFRALEFAHVSTQHTHELEKMVRFNWQNEFGAELEPGFELKVVRPAVTDSRMLPHKWLVDATGEIRKVDAATHGDSHFFPGPCDIAWDLAGAIVEWQLRRDAAQMLLEHYAKCGGDDARGRISAYEIGYATMRMAYSRLAARAMGGTEEEALFARDYERYRQQALEAHRLAYGLRPALMQMVPHAPEPEGTAAL